MADPPARRGSGNDGRLLAALLLALFAALCWLRPVDHDESQYVAAAILTAQGHLPYRDYAWLQTPLHPFALAPVAWAAGAWAWPALRLANAVFGWIAVVATAGAARAGGAGRRQAWAAAGLMAGCDILLFAIGTARNDALPAACLALALWLALRRPSAVSAAAIGLLLASAAAAKISYALPAATYGVLALTDARRRPGWVAWGAVLPIVLVAASYALAPAGFVFGVLDFPAHAPAEWFAARADKLSPAAKLFDLVKFLALGATLPALVTVARCPRNRIAAALLIAGLCAAALPSPVWRQYLLPALPPLFVLLALRWTARPPGRAMRTGFAVFAVAGLAPTFAAIAAGTGMPLALTQGARLKAAMDRAGVSGPVATLAPQLVSLTGRMPDRRFATGPFVFRTRAIVAPGEEAELHVVPHPRLFTVFAADPPTAIVTGAEAWTSGDSRLDGMLNRWAAAHGYRRTVAGRSVLWVRPAMTPR